MIWVKTEQNKTNKETKKQTNKLYIYMNLVSVYQAEAVLVNIFINQIHHTFFLYCKIYSPTHPKWTKMYFFYMGFNR